MVSGCVRNGDVMAWLESMFRLVVPIAIPSGSNVVERNWTVRSEEEPIVMMVDNLK